MWDKKGRQCQQALTLESGTGEPPGWSNLGCLIIPHKEDIYFSFSFPGLALTVFQTTGSEAANLYILSLWYSLFQLLSLKNEAVPDLGS